MLKLANMSPKFIMTSGETNPDILAKQGPVLGLPWEPQHDHFEMEMEVNLSKKISAGSFWSQ